MTDMHTEGGVVTRPRFGIAPGTVTKLLRVFEAFPGLQAVWVFGSRATGTERPESDIDLAVDAPGIDERQFLALKRQLDELELIYRTDVVWLQEVRDEAFRQAIVRDRQVFWQPRRHPVAEEIGATQLKPFQATALGRLDDYLKELGRHRAQADRAATALRAAEVDVPREVADFPARAWGALRAAGALPPTYVQQPHSSRFDGAGRPVPNVCLKIPTGGGKTLLAAASVGRVFSSYLGRHTGLVLWIVPNDAIYRQTLKTLKDRDHPYHQMLNVAGAGRVKILEKNSPLSRLDTDSHLCVMLLMLASAARQSKETLRFFRDRGNVLGYTPPEDDYEAHFQLLSAVPNLDAYAPWGASAAEARATRGSVVKSSLGNVMRMLRPMVVIDEGHHGYTENALATIDGFNPSFMLELSATPRVSSDKGSGSNILVDVRGTDLDEAEMIKLPIHVDMRGWADWQSCLAAGVQRLDALHQEAAQLQAETNRYIRPILLVQVERTGRDLRDAGFIHAEDAKAHLLQMGFTERQIAIKTSERNDLSAPENIDLLSPQCEVRAIITKQALQEGWDCPFAYVLCALAAGKDLRGMTQLMGRILRQPQVAKTGRPALDSCYALCHDARTGEVVKAIKQSLESEGMGDLGLAVQGPGAESVVRRQAFRRRPEFAGMRIFLPRVTWVALDEKDRLRRRELAYESDVLARIDWANLATAALASGWAPDGQDGLGRHLDIGLDILQRANASAVTVRPAGAPPVLDRARLVRGLLDLAPNAWWAWAWVDAVIGQLRQQGHTGEAIAASAGSLLERLRVDVEAERDRLAEQVFETCLARGEIEFRLRADLEDYEIPAEFALELAGKPQPLIRDADAKLVEKSLFEPALTALADSGLERDVACYVDLQPAVRWWHRNVARAQYGLQGWKRHKVYPDFVFARLAGADGVRVVVLETKGEHLAGSADTAYKTELLRRLTAAFEDRSLQRAGEMELEGPKVSLVCDLLYEPAWEGALAGRHFGD